MKKQFSSISKPVASYWILGGFTGNRIGIGYCHSTEEAQSKINEKGFRWLKNSTLKQEGK